ncbi:MAG: mercury(II) reductase [Gemmatimonadetes bacterium]|nr:mercury(II) reductase [Gemmatimonadota bacterium]
MAADRERARGGAEYDLLVLGTGSAGMAAAIRGAELGARVGIVESGTIGGTCVNVGCIPSKNLLAAAEHVHAARRGFPGIEPYEPRFDWRAVLAQKSALVEGLRRSKYLEVLASYPAIEVLRGQARLLGDGRVGVGGSEQRARKVVIATGASPWVPPVPGLRELEPLDSTTAMELESLPRSLLVLGGSAVGLELGQMFARFGVRVIVLELLPRLLAGEEPAVSEALRSYLQEEGLEIHTGIRGTDASRSDGEVVLRVDAGGRAREFRAERILVAAGRRANTEALDVAAAGVALERGFVRVDATMRTSNPDIYAAGDVTGGPGFVYVAALGGGIAAENALTQRGREIDLRAVPRVTFTTPQVGAVGLTEEEAVRAGHRIEVRQLELEYLPRAAVSRDARGFVKLVAEAGTGTLLGVHALAPNAGELLGEATLAVRLGLRVQDLTETLHPYLTWVEALKLGAQTFTTDVTKLSCCA